MQKTKVLSIRSETGISLEITLYAFKYLAVPLSTEILILPIVTLLISVSILYELGMLPEVYILLSPKEEEVHPSS